MQVFNTLGRKKQDFVPIEENQVTMYHCGPTVYWTQHIGNMRAMVLSDLVIRTFKYLGYSTKVVRNYTDVGHLTSDDDAGTDKMEKTAKAEKKTPQEIADKYIKEFEKDITLLNTLPVDVKPRATEYVQKMINMVEILLKKDIAYTTDLAIYFDISKAENYTALSGQRLDENLQGAGKAQVDDPDKRNAADFAVWFFRAGDHKNALQYWESPFNSPLVLNGEGFPGWHLECSAMALYNLGPTIDVHMGGIEHIPVHHTNEIAQSEACNGVKFANYWLHNEHLLVNGGKMSKSEGTGYSLSDVMKKGFDPLDFRFFLLQAHYRSKQNFTWDALEAAARGFKHLKRQVSDLGSNPGEVSQLYQQKFVDIISDDFNIPMALAVVQEVLSANITDDDKLATILNFDQVLGLKLDQVEKANENIPNEVTDLAKDRTKARKDGDWSKSDKLRDKINEMGYVVEDTEEGPKVRKK